MYSVVSPKKEVYPLFEEFFKSYSKYPMDLLIRENGTTGDHPHLNIIWDTSVKKRTQDLTGLLKKHMAKASLPNLDSPVLLRTRVITDVNTLIGGYLQKEENYSVLYDSKKYDIAALKVKYGKPFTGKYKWRGIMSFSNAPLDIMEYCENVGIDYVQATKLASPQQEMLGSNVGLKNYSSNADYCIRLLMEISHVHMIQVHHLFRKASDIHLGVLALYGIYDVKLFS